MSFAMVSQTSIKASLSNGDFRSTYSISSVKDFVPPALRNFMYFSNAESKSLSDKARSGKLSVFNEFCNGIANLDKGFFIERRLQIHIFDKLRERLRSSGFEELHVFFKRRIEILER